MRTDPDRFEELADQYNTYADGHCSDTRVPRAIGEIGTATSGGSERTHIGDGAGRSSPPARFRDNIPTGARGRYPFSV